MHNRFTSSPTPANAQPECSWQTTGDDPLIQERLIRSLAEQIGQGSGAQLVETHISWVLLLPDVAYKFKKALHLEFLDYSTLAARQFHCQEELRLNRRLAPDIYLGVVKLTGTRDEPEIDGQGPILDYAVKMRAFDQTALWDDRLRKGLLTAQDATSLAQLLAIFHRDATPASDTSLWGTTDAIVARTNTDLAAIAPLLDSSQDRRLLARVTTWHSVQQRRLRRVFMWRKSCGRIRECHGDLHCGNILTIGDQVLVFDCIEFNDSMRWIDVMHDFAFIWMDLQCRGRHDLAARLLTQYLQSSGDYGGLAVLPYYLTQRALVRCKVALLRARQLGSAGENDAANHAREEARQYLQFAATSVEPRDPALIITHGFSGSGKSTVCDSLIEPLGAVQIRSDVERKRIHGLAADASAHAPPGAGIYGATASDATYRCLSQLARHIIATGLPVLVDAAFLDRMRRNQFRDLARQLRVPFLILDVQVRTRSLRIRLLSRATVKRDVSDADLAVLTHQLSKQQSLLNDELGDVIALDNEGPIDRNRIGMLVKGALRRRVTR